MPMKRRPSRLATAPVVPVPKNGSSTTSPGRERGEDDAVRAAPRASASDAACCRRPFEPLLAGAERDGPVGAHLHVVVAGLQRLVVERVAARRWLARRPDQRLVRVGEAAAAEIRHRVDLAPHHVVEDPEAEILQDRADAEDVVIGADHPQRRRRASARGGRRSARRG